MYRYVVWWSDGYNDIIYASDDDDCWNRATNQRGQSPDSIQLDED